MVDYVARQVVSFQNGVSAGASAATADLEKLAAAGERVDVSVEKVGRSANSLKNQFDPVSRATRDLAAAQKSLSDTQSRLSDDMARGGTTAAEYDRAVAGAAAAVEKKRAALRAANQASSEMATLAAQGTDKLRLQAHEWQNLSFQIQDAAVQLAGGQSPFLIMMQQGPQASGAVGGLSRGWALLRQEITLSRVAVLGIGAGIAAIAVAAESSERSLNTLQNRLRLTRTDYVAAAAVAKEAGEQFADDSQFSRADGRQAAGILLGASKGTLSLDETRRLTAAAADLATVMGTTLPEAAEGLARALRDPAASIREMSEKGMPGFNAALVRQADLLVAAGKKGEAFTLFMDRFSAATKGAHTNITPLEAAVAGIGNSFRKAWEAAEPYALKILEVIAAVSRTANKLDSFALNNPLVRGLNSVLGINSTPEGGPSTPTATSVPPVPQSRQRIDAAMGTVSELNPRAYRQQMNRAQAQGLRDALNQPGITPDEVRAIKAGLGELAEQYAGMEPAMAGFLRGLQQQAKIARVAEGAARELAQAEAEANETARSAGQGHAGAATLMQVRAAVQERLTGQLIEYQNQLHQQADAELLQADAWQRGARAAGEAADEHKAFIEALKYGKVGSDEYFEAITRISGGMKRLRDDLEAARNAKALFEQGQQLEFLKKEGDLIGANAAHRERELAALRERQKIESEKGLPESEAGRRRIENARLLTDEARANTQLENSWNELGRVGEQAFDRIGSAITEAFANGTLKAISFGDIARAVLSEVVQAALKLAVINPIMNSLFGGTRGTAAGIGTVLAKSGSMGGAGSGAAVAGTSIMEYGSGALSIGKSFMGSGVSQTGWGFVDDTLNTPLYSTGADGFSTASYGPYSAANPSGGVSVGGAIGGVAGVAGGLYGIYTGAQTGGAKGWAQGVSGAASVVAGGTALAGGSAAVGAAGASALGASAGAALGAIAAAAPYIAIVALVASYFLSGQKPSDKTGVYRGNLLTGVNDVTGLDGDRFSQENRDLASNLGRSVSDMASSLRGALGVAVTPFNFEIAAGSRDGLVASYGGKEREFSNDEAGAKLLIAELTGAMIDSMKGLASAEVQSVLSHSSGTDAMLSNLDWYNGTYKPLSATQDTAPVTAYANAVKALNDQFAPLAAKAAELGLSLEPITAALTKGLDALNKARVDKFDATITSMLSDTAVLRGGNQLDVALAAFDKQRTTDWEGLVAQILDQGFDQNQVDAAWSAFTPLKALQRQQIIDQDAAARTNSSSGLWDRFQAASGSGATLEGARWDYERRAQAEWFAAARDGYTDLTLLARVQNEERLQIERNFAEKAAEIDRQTRDSAAQTATGLVVSLTDYARSLRYGDTSPLSFQAQYGAASDSLNAVSGAALAGDWSSITKVQTYAQDFLSASRAINGSGLQYAMDMQRVTELLGGVVNMGADRLTDSARQIQAIDSQTTTLVSELQALRAEVVALRVEQRQAGSAPARANAA